MTYYGLKVSDLKFNLFKLAWTNNWYWYNSQSKAKWSNQVAIEKVSTTRAGTWKTIRITHHWIHFRHIASRHNSSSQFNCIMRNVLCVATCVVRDYHVIIICLICLIILYHSIILVLYYVIPSSSSRHADPTARPSRQRATPIAPIVLLHSASSLFFLLSFPVPGHSRWSPLATAGVRLKDPKAYWRRLGRAGGWGVVGV